MLRTSALTRKPKGLGRRNFAQGYPRSHATPTLTSRSIGQRPRWGGGILWRRPSRTACLFCMLIVVLDADEEFVIFSRNTFWTGLFIKHFLEVADDTLRDDMLFYVRKCRAKSKSKTQQVGLLCTSSVL